LLSRTLSHSHDRSPRSKIPNATPNLSLNTSNSPRSASPSTQSPRMRSVPYTTLHSVSSSSVRRGRSQSISKFVYTSPYVKSISQEFQQRQHQLTQPSSFEASSAPLSSSSSTSEPASSTMSTVPYLSTYRRKVSIYAAQDRLKSSCVSKQRN